jgi:hypothetical protein
MMRLSRQQSEPCLTIFSTAAKLLLLSFDERIVRMSLSSLVKYIDHLMIHVDTDADTFSQFVSLWTDLLGCPLAFPLTPLVREPQMVFSSLGLFAGNVYLELYQLGASSPERPQLSPCTQTARLYGVAFEPQQEDITRSLWELHARQIPFLPPLLLHGDQDGAATTSWTMIFLGDFLGSDLSQARTMRQDQFLGGLHTVFSRGLFFLSQFSRDSYQQTRVLRPQHLRLRERLATSPVGLLSVREIVVGATDVAAAHQLMQRLCAPREPEGKEANVWRFEQGPAIRLEACAEDRLLALVFQVRSVEQARTFLRQCALLDPQEDQAHDGALLLNTTALLGLAIFLTE